MDFRYYFLALFAFSFSAGLAQKSLINIAYINKTYSAAGMLYFSANDNLHGEELWVSNGTPEGTLLLKDINPGYGSSTPNDFIEFNNKIFFSAYTAEYGMELWMSDGTPEGTKMVVDLEPSDSYYQGSNPKNLVVFKEYLYFTTSTGGLYRTDGTQDGTVLVDQMTYGTILSVTLAGDYLYYYKGTDLLNRTNGSSLSTIPLPLSDEEISFNSIYATNQNLFAIKTSSYFQKIKLYVFNANDATWTELKYFNAPLYGDHDLKSFTAVGNKLFFNLRTDYENVNPTDELWVTDGSVTGTQLLKSFNWNRHSAGSGMENLKGFNEDLYFRSGETAQKSLWKSDGTVSGTSKFHDVVMVQPYNITSAPVISDDKLFFSGAMPNDYNFEVWVTDGTAGGTRLFADLNQNSGSNPHYFCDVQGVVYCVTQQQQFVTTLWSMAAAPKISVKDQFNTIANGGSLNFNEVAVDECLKKTLTIENMGRKELLISGIRIIGNGFYLKGSVPELLNPNEKILVDVYFSPLSSESQNATLTVFSNDQNEPQYTLNIVGKPTTAISPKFCEQFDETFRNVLMPTIPPKSIQLSKTSVIELQPAASLVGLISVPESSASISYSLVPGIGDEDNYQFSIATNQLLTRWPLKFTFKNTYSIRILADAGNGIQWVTNFTITVESAPVVFAPNNCTNSIQQMDFSFNDIALNSDGDLFAVTSNSSVLKSSDEGITWKQVNTGSLKGSFRKIVFKGSIGYITGDDAILKSEDNGETWFQLLVPRSSLTYFVSYFLDANTGYIADYTGKIYFTGNGGETWETRPTNQYERITAMYFFNPEKGIAIKGYRDLILTNDGGKTWSNINLSNLGFISSQFTDIAFRDQQNGYLTSYNSLYKTSNGGASWTKVDNLFGEFSAVRFFSNTTGYLYGGWFGPVLYKTTDGGLTWSSLFMNSPGAISGIVQTTSGKLVTSHATNYGSSTSPGRALNVSLDGGLTWQQEQELPGVDYGKIDFISQNTGFLFGQSSIWKTVDSGLSWKKFQWNKPISSTYFLDENNALLSDGSSIYKTSDGGQTIMEVFTPNDPNNYAPIGTLYGVSNNVIFSFGWYAIYRSVNGGNSWQLMSASQDYYMQDLQFLSDNIGYSMELFGSIRKSIDGGTTWTEIFTRDPYESAPHNSLFFVDEMIGYKAGRHFYKTTDGGVTWAKIFTNFSGDVMKLFFTDEAHGFAATRSGFLYETVDGGISWSEKRLSHSYNSLNSIQFKFNNIYYCGQYGLVGQISKPVSSPEIPGYIVGPKTVCVDDTKTYKVASDYYVGYQWASSTARIEQQGAEANVNFPSFGLHNLSLKLVNSCGVSESRTITIDVRKIDEPIVSGPEDPSAGQTDVKYSIVNSNPSLSYSWSVPRSLSFEIESADPSSIKVNWKKETGEASVNVIAADRSAGCRARGQLDIELLVVTGLEVNADIVIYPNPTRDDFLVDSDQWTSFEGVLLNATGQKILTIDQLNNRVSLRTYPSGLYFLQLQNPKTGDIVTIQVIKI